MKKVCRKCKIEKEIDSFPFDKSAKDGYSNRCKICRSIYYRQHFKYHKEYNKKYIIHYRPHRNERERERRKNEPIFKLTTNIRNLIKASFNKNNLKKNTKTTNILGCSIDEFKIHLESKFEPWMNWNNHGLYNGELNYGWDIDHIISLHSAKTEEDIIRLNHYTNLQPLCSYVNRIIKKHFNKTFPL